VSYGKSHRPGDEQIFPGAQQSDPHAVYIAGHPPPVPVPVAVPVLVPVGLPAAPDVPVSFRLLQATTMHVNAKIPVSRMEHPPGHNGVSRRNLSRGGTTGVGALAAGNPEEDQGDQDFLVIRHWSLRSEPTQP
jgi:hypothetical protein